MQSLNVLVVGQKYINRIKSSKYLNKLYTTSEEEFEDVISIKFNTFKELAQKCKALQIDIVLIEEEKWILEGIANVMKQNFVNSFAVTSKWTDLGLSHHYAREMLSKYEIKVPPIVNLPFEFPVIVKGDGVLKKAFSMQEIISIKEKIYNNNLEISKNVFLEKYLNGEKCKIISLFDGKTLLTFPNENISANLLKEYSLKLEKMFLEEKADFVGFINSEVIEENGILYNTGFSFNFEYPDMDWADVTIPKDILYICLSTIYQKLSEIKL